MGNSAGPGSSLTAKQERFVEEYLIDLNATQAAIRAGYSEKGAHVRGSELLSNRKIADAIALGRKRLSEESGITQAFVLECITEAITLSKGGENVMGIYKGAELLGKHLGMFEGGGAGDDKPQRMQFDINVNAPVKDVRVTKPE